MFFRSGLLTQSEKSYDTTISVELQTKMGTRITPFGFNTISEQWVVLDVYCCLVTKQGLWPFIVGCTRTSHGASKDSCWWGHKGEQHNDSDGRRTDKQTFLLSHSHVFSVGFTTTSIHRQNPVSGKIHPKSRMLNLHRKKILLRVRIRWWPTAASPSI